MATSIVWTIAGRCSGKQPWGRAIASCLAISGSRPAWPVPTHPLLEDGKVYALGGCWPADGVHMNAFDLESGKLLWKSPSMHMRAMRVPHWIADGHVYVRTYSGTGGKAARFDIQTGVASYWPKGTTSPILPRVNFPGGDGINHSHQSNGLYFGTGGDGTLYCAGPGQGSKPRHHAQANAQQSSGNEKAKAILQAAGQKEGFALVAGLADGAIVESLIRHSTLYIVAVDDDAAKVDRIRRKLDRLGCFDTHRLSVMTLDWEPDVLPPYFANIVLSESGHAPNSAAMLSVRPYGGVSLTQTEGSWKASIRGALEGAGNWTHEYANTFMNNSTSDRLVKAPLGVQWYGGPASDRKYYLSGNRPTGALVVDGRMFLQGDGVACAVDVYTGRLLWEAEIPKMHIYNGTHGGGGGGLSRSRPWEDEKAAAKGVPPTKHSRASGFNWAAATDCIYIFAGDQCLRFDSRTGETLPSWPLPLPKVDGELLCWGCPRIMGDVLVATAFRPTDLRDARIGSGGNGGDWASDRTPMSHLFAVNRTTGDLLWSKSARLSFNNRALVATSDRVFCTDLLQSDAAENFIESGRKIPTVEASLRAFDLQTGKEVWSKPLKRLVKYISYSEKNDMLLVPNRYGREWTGSGWGWPGLEEQVTRKKSGRPNGVFRAYRGRTGELIWEISEQHYDGPYTVVGDKILNRYGTAFDPATGKLAMRRSPITGLPESYGFKKSGCAVLGGCDSLVAWRTAYHDLTTGTSVPLPGFEAGCTTSLLPASGVMNLPNFGMFHLRARAVAVSMVHRPSAKPWRDFQVTKASGETPIQHIGYNLGAPGDRHDQHGTLWVRAVRGDREFGIEIEPRDIAYFSLGGDGDWIGNSGIRGAAKILLPTSLDQNKNSRTKSRYDVRLVFADPTDEAIGSRVFDVMLEGKVVLSNLDLAREKTKLVIREFKDLEIQGRLDIELVAKSGEPILCGVEIVGRADPSSAK